MFISLFSLFVMNSTHSLSLPTLTKLPVGVSSYERRLAKTLDIQSSFRTLATRSIKSAIDDGVKLIELDFPPLLGGRLTKTQFDDFDNISELNANSDFTMQLVPSFNYAKDEAWVVFPDLKECNVASETWPGKSFQNCARTTIEASLNFLSPSNYKAPWGSNLVKAVSSDLLGDSQGQSIIKSPPGAMFFVQPGNAGPVEDWINIEQISSALDNEIPCIVVNGALDKLRNGYYARIFFPALAKTVDRFYSNFESVFYLKPIADKGESGFLFRCYPEDWQIIKETINEDDDFKVTNEVIHTSAVRPPYKECIRILLQIQKN